MSKKRLIRSISRKGTKKIISWEKERLTRQEGVNNKALDPQRSYKTIFKFISQVVKDEI